MDNMEMNPGAVPPPVPDANHPMGLGFAETLGSMRFVGWMGLVYGALSCLSIAGAIVGIPLIIACNRFLGGIKRFENYRHHRSEAELRAGFEDLGSSFKTIKILSIIYIVLIVGFFGLMIAIGGIGLLAGLAESSSG